MFTGTQMKNGLAECRLRLLWVYFLRHHVLLMFLFGSVPVAWCLLPGAWAILTVVQLHLCSNYTSLIGWYDWLRRPISSAYRYREFCLRHPKTRDSATLARKAAWYLTAVMFTLNNTFIGGLHVLFRLVTHKLTGDILATNCHIAWVTEIPWVAMESTPYGLRLVREPFHSCVHYP